MITTLETGTAGLVLVLLGAWAGWELRWRKQIDDAYKHAQRRESYIATLENAIAHANGLCRTAFQIAERNGEKTDWPGFRDSLHESLVRQHAVMYPPNDQAQRGRAQDAMNTTETQSGSSLH